MSQRGRGSGRGGDDPDDLDPAREQDTSGIRLPAMPSRPIAPYDPYRPRGADVPRLPGRGASDVAAPLTRRPSRPSGDAPFLPDDDPLSAEAWSLELDEPAAGIDVPPVLDADGEVQPPRRPRRAPSSSRVPREPAPEPPRPGRRARARTTATRAAAPRAAISISMPRAVAAAPLAADQTALILLGINGASILVMVLLLGVRLGGIPSPTALHLDAAGNVDRWGPVSVLWRLPLMSLVMTAMFLIVAWFVFAIDRFAARFALAAAVVVQLIAWVAVIQHLR